jgi:hypothetical protein
LIYILIVLSLSFCIIVLLELRAFSKKKEKVFHCIRRTISKKKKNKLLSDIELLYKEVSVLPPDMFRKLNFAVRIDSEDTFTSKMINTQYVSVATIIATIAMVSTWILSVEPSSVLPYLNKLMNFSMLIIAIIGMMSVTFLIHLKIEDSKSKFIQKFILVINEIEKEQPITVRLSEAQYQVLSASSNLQRNVFRYGRSENP